MSVVAAAMVLQELIDMNADAVIKALSDEAADYHHTGDIFVFVAVTGKPVAGRSGSPSSVYCNARVPASEFDAADPASVGAATKDTLDKVTTALMDKIDPDNFLRRIAADLAEMG